jgi:hypothetical protein
MSRLLGVYIERDKAPSIATYLEYDKFYDASIDSISSLDGCIYMNVYIDTLGSVMYTQDKRTPHLHGGDFTLVYSNR